MMEMHVDRAAALASLPLLRSHPVDDLSNAEIG
jgi:hypothetical protein